MDEVAIKVEAVSKVFKLPHEKSSSIKGALINKFKGGNRGFETQEVLKNISFEIKKGEFFGIVGRNGSGKSTLLKMLAGIYTPTKGSIHVNGKLTPFIELGVGFNPELTGRENVFLNGALLGFNRKEMEAMYDDIVAFAELERFMDQKLKNYSSGMQVRLAFSIAIRAQSDILLLDEVLAVGDAAFQRKCFEYFLELKRRGQTVVLVTHDMTNIEKFCNRALVIGDGEALGTLNPQEASALYSKMNVDENELVKQDKKTETDQKNRWGDGTVKVNKIGLYRGKKLEKIFTTGGSLAVKMDLSYTKGFVGQIVIGLAIHDSYNRIVAGPNSTQSPIKIGSKTVTFEIDKLPLGPGDYTVTAAIYDETTTRTYDYLDRWAHFSVVSDHMVNGAIEIDNANWSS